MIDLREESAAIRTLAYNGDPVPYLDYMSKNIFQWLSNRDLIGFWQGAVPATLIMGIPICWFDTPICRTDIPIR